MDIKYFKLATLFATGLFFAFLVTADYGYEIENAVFLYPISLVVIWGSYFIMKEEEEEDGKGSSKTMTSTDKEVKEALVWTIVLILSLAIILIAVV